MLSAGKNKRIDFSAAVPSALPLIVLIGSFTLNFTKTSLKKQPNITDTLLVSLQVSSLPAYLALLCLNIKQINGSHLLIYSFILDSRPIRRVGRETSVCRKT